MQKWHRWHDWVNLIAGAWLFFTPWIFGYTDTSAAAWNAWLLGVAVMVISLWTLSAPESRPAEWLNAIAGAWVFLAPWILAFTGVAAAAWNAWIVGVVVIVLALWALSTISSESRISHGTPQHT